MQPQIWSCFNSPLLLLVQKDHAIVAQIVENDSNPIHLNPLFG
jgi:hypothetical protein